MEHLPSTVLRAITITVLALFIPSGFASAGSVLGDTFQIRVLIDGVEIPSSSGVAGSGNLALCSAPGSSCTAGSQHDIQWIDGDTFRVDWFDTTAPGPARVVYEISGLDFVSAGAAEGVLGVFQQPSSLPPAARLAISYTRDSITLDYDGLSSTDAGDGDLGLFDVETSASLANTHDIEILEDGASVAMASHVRGQAGAFDIAPTLQNGQYLIEWLDDDSFRVDWFTDEIVDVVLDLTGLEFKNIAGRVGTIDSVVKGPSGFPNDPIVTVGASSITLSYLGMALSPNPESNDGDLRVFDVQATIPRADVYSVELQADAAVLGKATSARGAVDTYPLIDDYAISWVDDDTFEIDWFAGPIASLTWTLDFDGLTDASGVPQEITGVTKGDSGFDDDPTVGFTTDSITISYPSIIDPFSGDVRQFDIALPEPSVGAMLLFGTLAICGVHRRRARRPEGGH